MARNYMHDITPTPSDDEAGGDEMPRAERSIRDFRPSPARQRLATPRMQEVSTQIPQKSSRSRIGLWIAAALCVVVLALAGGLLLFSSTSITIIPHAQTMTFDASNPLTAYPATSAATGTIPYTVVTQVFEDSAVVAANGTEQAEEKATGSITVYNEYSDQPVRLIKNTRFQTADGLIFRIPASVDVPGKKGSTPGSINVTVFADQTGPKYNIASGVTLNVPGLKSTAEMYSKVYAKSTAAFSGGFSGTRPAVSPAILEAAKAEVRARLAETAQKLHETAPEGTIAFSGLSVISYETLPATEEGGGSVRIHERATVTMPTFSSATFASSVAQAVSAQAEGQSVTLSFSDGTSAQPVGALSAADIGTQPIVFIITGKAQLVWNLDTKAFLEALAGREEGAFESIVRGFPAVEEARARIMPFWKHTFPSDPTKIKIILENPPVQF